MGQQDFASELSALIHKYAMALTTEQITDALQDALDWVEDNA